jgi:hypothetical protein
MNGLKRTIITHADTAAAKIAFAILPPIRSTVLALDVAVLLAVGPIKRRAKTAEDDKPPDDAFVRIRTSMDAEPIPAPEAWGLAVPPSSSFTTPDDRAADSAVGLYTSL